MKKLKLSLFVISLVLVNSQSNANFHYLFLKELPEGSLLRNISFRHIEFLNSIILVPNSHFIEEEAIEMIKNIDNLPEPLLQKLVDHRIYIQLFTGYLTDHPSTMNLRGLTPRGYANSKTTWDDVPGIGGGQVVLVKIGSSKKGAGHGSINLELHELAHSIDNIVFDKIRDDPMYLNIWREEVTSLFGDEAYFQLFPEEYFAETFAMFYASKDTNQILIEKAPKTYTLISLLK